MNKIYLLIISIVIFTSGFAQTVEIAANASTSGNLPFGTSNYAASESIYTQTEVGASNFTTAGTAITHLAFNCSTVGANTTFTSVKIYFKDVSLATTTFTTGTYTNAGYTLVYNGSVTNAAVGYTEIVLATPYIRATGTNLQMLIERTDNITHAGFVWATANGNNTSAALNTTRRYNAATVLSGSTSLTASVFRPAIRLIHKYPNDAAVTNVYTLGKLPIPNAAPRTDSARVTNAGINTLTSIPVTLTITGANSFTNTQTIASLAPGASANVVFAAYTPTVQGTNNVSVSVPSDDDNTNNTLGVSQTVNLNTWSYAYGTVASGGVGFNGASGDFVAKFNTNAATAVSQVSVNFSAGGQPYQIGIWDASGAGGAPGVNLYTSTTQTSASGVNVLPVSPAVSVPAGNFYVGVKQTGIVNVSFSYQTETPIRSQTFYFTSPSGGTAWNDFAPANSFRFMIEPKLILSNDASVSNLNINLPSNSVSCASLSNPTVTLNNPGLNPILPGTATVTFKSTGANSNNIVQTNSTTIASGGTETIVFTGATFVNAGVNNDTAFVVYAGDLDKSNDTVKIQHTTAPTINLLPAVENAETTLPTVPYAAIVSGSRNLWLVQTGNYSNADQTNPLPPHGGTKFFLFDSYSGANSAGFITRLYSNCINLPAGPNEVSFWMSHDNTSTLATFLDSMYVSVSTDKGATWIRLPVISTGGGLQRHDGTLVADAAPIWRKDVIDLSAYAGQTIQIGFEGVSKYGNAFGLDDISVPRLTSFSNDYFRTITSGNWNAPATWESSTTSDFSAGVASPASLSPNAAANTIDIKNGHTVTVTANVSTDQTNVNPGGTLIVTGSTLTVSGAAGLIVQSSSAGTGIIGNSTGTITGSVTVERYINSDVAGRKWHLLSGIATTSSQNIRAAWQEGGGAPVTPNIGTWITDAGTPPGFDGPSLSASILKHNPAGSSWLSVGATNSGSINDERGYMLFVRGDRFANPGNALQAQTVLRTTGTLNQGTQPAVTVLNASPGYTIMGNPFASPIDLENILTTANLGQFFYVWDASIPGNFNVGKFRLVQKTGPGSYTATPSTGSDNTLRYIHSGQAFFLKASGGNASVVFNESDKTNLLSVVNPIVNTTGKQQIYTELSVADQGSTEYVTDAVRVWFNASNDAGTTDDILKMGNFSDNISSYREDKKWIIENRPMIAGHDTIFLRMSGTSIHNYRLRINTLDFTQSNITAFLQDTWLNSSKPLSLDGSVVTLDFSVTADAASANQDRFRIVFAAKGPQPQTITTIKAAQQGTAIAVDWKASSQYNMKQYEVEKSTDGINYTKVNTQTATGSNGSDANYTWLDVKPVIGNNHYRIRSVDNSGNIKVTQSVTVFMGKGNAGITVYPNPVTNRNIGLLFSDMEKGIYQLRLLSTTGQVVFTKTVNHTGGSATQSLPLGYKIAKGSYQLEISKPDHSKTTKAIIITE